MNNYRTRIQGTGIYLPKKVLTNFDLAHMVDTSDEWIFARTGIRERRIASTSGGEFPTDMAMHAARMALTNAAMTANDIEMIIFASVTPDVKLPNSASILQTKLNITNKCACFDLAAACSGFLYALNLADTLVKSGAYNNILVVSSEMLSRETDWTDRRSCILFGDGCGAFIVGRAGPEEDSEIVATLMTADGTGREYFSQPVGGAVAPITHQDLDQGTHFMQMKGTEMFKVATRTLAQSAKEALAIAGLTPQDLSWAIPHQANYRIIETTMNLLGFPMDKTIVTIEKYGNNSAATIPIAFHEAVADGHIKRGQYILLDAFGAGLTAAATILKY